MKKDTEDPAGHYTKKDEMTARKRVARYLELSAEGLTFDEILPKLPRGGTKRKCGHTRFQHAETGGCKKEE